jgi:hypothetical protein
VGKKQSAPSLVQCRAAVISIHSYGTTARSFHPIFYPLTHGLSPQSFRKIAAASLQGNLSTAEHHCAVPHNSIAPAANNPGGFPGNLTNRSWHAGCSICCVAIPMSALFADLRYAFRQLRHNPGFASSRSAFSLLASASALPWAPCCAAFSFVPCLFRIRGRWSPVFFRDMEIGELNSEELRLRAERRVV